MDPILIADRNGDMHDPSDVADFLDRRGDANTMGLDDEWYDAADVVRGLLGATEEARRERDAALADAAVLRAALQPFADMPTGIVPDPHPCTKRCWRIGGPANVQNGECLECGSHTRSDDELCHSGPPRGFTYGAARRVALALSGTAGRALAAEVAALREVAEAARAYATAEIPGFPEEDEPCDVQGCELCRTRPPLMTALAKLAALGGKGGA